MLRIRGMTVADIPLGMRLKEQAGWNQVEADWRRLLDLQPDGCFVAELDGIPAGTVTTCRFGPVAWVAMMLVDESFRSRGIGRALMSRALDDLDSAGVRSHPPRCDPSGTSALRVARFRGGGNDSRDTWAFFRQPMGRLGCPKHQLPNVLEGVAELDRQASRAPTAAACSADWSKNIPIHSRWPSRPERSPGSCWLVPVPRRGGSGRASRASRPARSCSPTPVEGMRGSGHHGYPHRQRARRRAGRVVGPWRDRPPDADGPRSPSSGRSRRLWASCGTGEGLKSETIGGEMTIDDSTQVPDTIRDVEHLDRLLSTPTEGVIDTFSRLDGDVIILGVAGKMGPTLAWMARRAFDACGPARPARRGRRAIHQPGNASPGSAIAVSRRSVATCSSPTRSSSFPRCPTSSRCSR